MMPRTRVKAATLTGHAQAIILLHTLILCLLLWTLRCTNDDLSIILLGPGTVIVLVIVIVVVHRYISVIVFMHFDHILLTDISFILFLFVLMLVVVVVIVLLRSLVLICHFGSRFFFDVSTSLIKL
jgi:hypothetical protein